MQDVESRRRRIGWSQDELAEVANVSTRTVWAAEHDRHVGAKSVAAIQAALDRGERQRMEELEVRLGRSAEAPTGLVEPPQGTAVVDLSTPDGRVKIAVALEPGASVDMEELRQTLLRIHEESTRRRTRSKSEVEGRSEAEGSAV